MGYQALYRVWRSQRFDDVVGQKAITQTLKNAVIQNQISHAYLFTGPRGTGKTSAAKIFAKAINCPNSHDGEPCNECDMCRAITAGKQEDVIEIDAASNNGVDEIRFITDRAKYAPTQAKYKVYIIDEVHMLSTGAFNALLKTLEEPQESLVFILATTEPHKIPATIISRTQRFDFKRIDTQDIAEHLAYILGQIDVPYEEQALKVIAQAAEGGMRDALSMLDQAISFADGRVTMKDVMEVTGSLSYERMDQFMEACRQQDTAQALADLDEMLASGKEARRLLENLLVYCRDLLLYQKAPALLTEKNGYLTEGFKTLAGEVTAEQLFFWIKQLNETQNEIRFTNSPRIYLEVAAVKLCGIAPTNPSNAGSSATQGGELADLVQQLQQQVNRLTHELKELQQQPAQVKSTSATSSSPSSTKTTSKYRLPKERVYRVLDQATNEDVTKVREVWDELLTMFDSLQKGLLRNTEIKAAGPQGLVLSFEAEMVCQKASEDEQLALMISNHMSRLISGYAPEIVFIPESSWLGLRQSYLQQRKARKQGGASAGEEQAPTEKEPPKEEPIVEKAQAIFGDLTSIVND